MREIDVTELESVLASGAPLVDVREADEFAGGHVPGAVSIPLSEFVARVDEVPADATVYMICAVGGRSGQAAEYLVARGVDAVNVAGGTMAWMQSGRAVDAGS
ncbi:rhodanese-like domain-containing protein [Rhodococcus sp. TAF43]|jgi:rhodanese-related sulfurtransferase|uniref:rhodanese-like domain-containing protein n=1 Tax=unclassified Rhodococcus (in: high G+C Gram-positive bacteria) TaxID=192944 RepID=UPI000E0B2BEA|nr:MULTISPECIES: rhodanese-like domain-containing protein [unclassified Rhodococcus (in: high G+C Gram-positive bacteria)]QKT12650.1 rhodanese-like domain-containing protein [Rhodococcus sp. W8901]RDI16124.1 rhodanese-related sulfurtransferase [Rhodococcus sp. AG1013]